MRSTNSIMKKLGAPKKHLPKRAVKGLIASNFYCDGVLFVEKYDLVADSDTMANRSFRAKMMVDLAMSIECSLKSQIVALSRDNETPAEAYKAARKLGHSLDKLRNEIKLRAKHRIELPDYNEAVFQDLKSLGVGSRYSYEIWSFRFHEHAGAMFLGDNLVSRTVDNQRWEKAVRQEAVKEYKFAAQCMKKYLSKHNLMTGARAKKFHAEVATFVSSL